MSDTQIASGSCQCGKVTVTAKAASKDIGVCHCGMCRKMTAGPFFAVDCGSEVQIDGQEHVSIFKSSEWAERAFCNCCGTVLYYKLTDNNQFIVSSELFDDGEFDFTYQIFVDDKPDHYDFANKTVMKTGAEVFAAAESN